MPSHYDITSRWLDVILKRTNKRLFSRSGSNVIAEGDRIYSYGRHFEIARLLRDAKGEPERFLLNGDRVSVSTTRHQSVVRNAVRSSGLPSVIIPHSALAASGIDLDTIELVEVTEDRTETIRHSTTTAPEGAAWSEFEIFGYVPLSPEEVQALLDRKNDQRFEEWERKHRYHAADLEQRKNGDTGHYMCWEFFVRQHPMPPRPFTHEDLSDWDLKQWAVTGTKRVFCFHGNENRPITVTERPDGLTQYAWTTSRHWLGESLVRAAVPYSGTTPCKACAGTGRADGKPARRRDPLHEHLTWEQWDAGNCPTCLGSGGRPWRRRRWAYFLSGFDMQESNGLYFFCELPRGVKPTTIAEAYEALKPDTVKLAEQMGRTVRRQGDIFAVELRGADKRSLRKAGARFEKHGTLLGTNHTATEVAYMPDRTTLVRGVLTHDPAGRRPDHRKVRLDKGWHVVLKNTVPISR